MAADLEGVFRDSKAAPYQLSRLAIALAAVYNHLDLAERSGRANAVADVLVAALRSPKYNPMTVSQLAEALATLCAYLDRSGAVRTADALLAVLDDPNVQAGASGPIPATHLDRFVSYEPMFKRIAARLDERDLQRLLDHYLAVGRLQRALLDVLAGSKNRSFRNTWDYLDSTESNGNGTDWQRPAH
jgi:hypothetical protein